MKAFVGKRPKRSPNARLAQNALFGHFGIPQNASRRAKARLCGILLHHIFAALVLLRKPLFGQQKRRQPVTLDDRQNL